MATVTFYLNKNKKDKNGLSPIILQCDHKSQRFKYYTGEKINPIYWSKSKTSYIRSSYNDDSTLNNYLKSLVSKIDKIVRDAKTNDKVLTIDFIKSKFLETSDHKIEKSFFHLFEKFISSSESSKTHGTIKNYKTSLQQLKNYSSNRNFQFDFDSINSAFYTDFVDYLINEKKNSNNTIGKHIKTLKAFLTWTVDNKYSHNLEYKKFKVYRESIEIIYLTDQELKSLYNLEITERELEKARDLFCFGCFTGLRFSDIASVNNNNVSDNEIQIRTQKTKEIINIPLIPQASAILKKYNNVLPLIYNQKLNKALKILGRLAGINQYVAIQKYRGSKRIDSKIPKYDLITTHTARRTFITLSLEKGIRPEVVMSITGHKDYKTFKAYIKITDTVKKEALLNAWKY